MKFIKRLLLFVLVVLIIIVVYNYPRLNIISGYSAKSMSSSVFVGARTFEQIDATDNNFSPVNLAKDIVDYNAKTATASVYGFMKRTAVYREGLGSTLINNEFDINKPYLKPKRTFLKNDSIPYPFGTAKPKDTVFATIDYPLVEKALQKVFNTPEEDYPKTRAVLVIHKNHIIAEKYAKGFDENSKFLGWSMTKSIISTLYGILQKQGKIDIYDKVPIAEWSNDERAGITFNDLLQMNSGLEWDENYNTISDVTKMLFLEEDMTSSQQKKKAKAAPGNIWNYSSGTSNLLSGLLHEAFESDQEYLDFPYKALIDKIGMHSMLIETDMRSNFVGSSYGWGTARDWAKFGLLYLNKGNWNGEQIFDPSWVDYVKTPAPNSNNGYGGHFWLNAGGYLPDVPKDTYSANGYQGQRVFIIPSKDLIVVRFGLTDSNKFDFNDFLKDILSAIK